MTIPSIENDEGQKYSHFVPFMRGGMGEIYKGYEETTKQEVVIKLILINDLGEQELLSRELDACRHFSHKNVVETYLTGMLNIDGANYLYIIQKYYPKGNLRSLITENIPIEKCISMFLDIITGMKEIHKVIVHRDMKPENILVDIDGHLVITDFGLAKYIDERTRTKSFKGSGTIPYMAPECWMGDANTIAMDTYAIGIIFFEIITGKFPYEAKNESELRDCHMFKLLPDVSAFRSGVNTKLKQIIQKMTAKRPVDRFKNDDEIIEAITNALKLQTTDSLDIERLASMGNMAMQQATTTKLQAQKEAEKTDEWIKLLNIHITLLFNKVGDKVNAINERFETGKIVIQQSNDNVHDTNRSLRLMFNAKGVKFNFSKYNSVEQYEKRHYENSINFQKQHYQMVLQEPEKTYLGKNNFVLVGLAETTFKIGPIEYGFNLLLKIEPNEMYGEWYKMVFSKNIQPAEPSFGIDLSVFFTEYEKLMRSPWHAVKIDKLNDSDITNLLQMMMM